MALKIELGPTSQTAIELPVAYSSTFGKRQQSSKHRTLAGKLYVYSYGPYIRHQFKVDFISTANASIVNSWWENNSELLLFVTSDSITEVFSVLITNKDKPMNKFKKPYYTYRDGKLDLESY